MDTWTLFHTFSYDKKSDSMLIALKAWSDFGAHIPLIRSFSLGDNYPIESPIFPGEPIKYHFGFYYIVGLLEKFGTRIDFALTTEERIDQEKADELKQRWKEKYQGVFHDVAVLDSGLKPVPLKYTNRDFEFLNLAQWSREKVLASYRVPKSKLGFTEGNRQGNVQDDIAFNRESIQPRLSLWDEEITKEVMPTFNEKIEFKHLNPIPRDTRRIAS